MNSSMYVGGILVQSKSVVYIAHSLYLVSVALCYVFRTVVDIIFLLSEYVLVPSSIQGIFILYGH